MEKPRPLVHKSDEPHGYFWTIWGDWGLVAKSGFAFIVIICLFTYATQFFAGDNQRVSFEKALTSLSGVKLSQPITQRQAKLLKRGDLYSWRAVLWVSEADGIKPWIWEARIQKEGEDFRTVAVELEPYQKEKAESLELFDKIGPQ